MKIEQKAENFLTMLENFIQDRHEDIKLKIESESEKIHLSYNEIQSEVDKIKPLKELGYDTILCITRGGLIPSGMIAYQLGIKKIVNITASSYSDEDNSQSNEVKIHKLSKTELKILKESNRVLIVDDIVDTGNTMDAVFAYLFKHIGTEVQTYDTFSIVTKDKSYNNYYVYDFTDDERWITFPWDV